MLTKREILSRILNDVHFGTPIASLRRIEDALRAFPDADLTSLADDLFDLARIFDDMEGNLLSFLDTYIGDYLDQADYGEQICELANELANNWIQEAEEAQGDESKIKWVTLVSERDQLQHKLEQAEKENVDLALILQHYRSVHGPTLDISPKETT